MNSQSTGKMPVGPTAKMAVLQLRSLIPKRIEIKPIIRRQSGVMFQTIDITLRPMLDVLGTAVAIQDYFLGKSFEINFVVVASVIKTKKQDDGTMHHCRNQNRADRESCRCAEELTLRGLAVARRPVTQRSNEIAGVQAFLHF